MAYTKEGRGKPDQAELLRDVQTYFRECKDFYGPQNFKRAKDYDYYEGEEQTWTEAEEKERERDGKPTIRLNQINGVVDLIEGLESQSRLDTIAKPRSEADLPVAEGVTKGIKYVYDQNAADFKLSKAFSHALKGGVAWLIPVRNPDPMKEEILIEIESAFRVWVDISSEKDDLSDAKHLSYLKWVNIKDATAMHPKFATDLEDMVNDKFDWENEYLGITRPHEHALDYDDVGDEDGMSFVDRRKRQVLIIETWRRCPTRVHVLVYPDDRKEELHPDAVKKDGTLEERYLTEQQHATIYGDPMTGQPPTEVEIVEGYTQKMHLTIWTGDMILWDGPSPYQHNEFPFIPLWAYRRRNGEAYGIVRNLKSIQDEINIHASQALHILNTVRAFIKTTSPMDRNQVAREAARPDGFFEVNTDNDIKFERDTEALKVHMQMSQLRQDDLQRHSGVNDELLGLSSDAKSGVAIRERMKQGTMRIASIFDYYRMAKQKLAEQIVSLMAQYWSPQKFVRITEEMRFMEQHQSFVTPIQGMGEHTPLDPTQVDIAQARFNVVIEEGPSFGTSREAQLEMLKEMVQSLPMIAQFIAPDIVRASDLPDKEYLAQKLEVVLGLANAGLGGGPGAQPMADPAMAQAMAMNGTPAPGGGAVDAAMLTQLVGGDAQTQQAIDALLQQGVGAEQIKQMLAQKMTAKKAA